MGADCENCEILLMLDEEKINWYKQLSIENTKLHKKLVEQRELITILKHKLLDKRSTILSAYATDLINETRKESQNDTRTDPALEKTIKQKFEEVNRFFTIFNNEREAFQKEIEENERYCSEDIAYLRGLVDYFREALFNELSSSNKWKHYFIEKFSGLAAFSHLIILDTLKEEGEKLNDELKSRYRKTIEKSKEEIERQSLLVSKLRRHNRQLYLLIQRTKEENEAKVASLERNLQDLKITIQKLKEKNNYLHTQIKLEVEGCQNDIFDARKTIRKFIKPR